MFDIGFVFPHTSTTSQMNFDTPWNEEWTDGEALGGGGQGETRFVTSKADESKRAVLKLIKAHKWRDSKARRRMYQEVTNLKILRNAGGNVPEVFDANVEKFEYLAVPLYFVMEYVSGETLASLIQARGSLSVEDSVAVALGLCKTLSIAFKEGIVHRDIKPENILVRSMSPPDVVMVDFGLSFNEDENQTNTSVDEGLDNKFVSLPERRGPGENKRDPRSDITDVCAILFYCLTGCSPRNLRDSQGRPPHRRENYGLAGYVQDGKQLSLLNGLLDRGLNYEVDFRFQTVEELFSRLNEVADPTAKPKAEDLDMVVAREAAALRKNDRKTQLSDYFARALALNQSVNSCVVDLNNRLAKHFNMFSLSSSGAGQWVRRGADKIAEGDEVAKLAIMLKVKNHNIQFCLRYSIIAVGTECTLYREIEEVLIGKPPKPVEQKAVVLRYQGESEIDRAAVIADIRDTVTRSIPLLSQRVQSGY